MSSAVTREQFFAERNQAIAHEFGAGVPLSDIAARFELGEFTIYTIAKSLGVKRRRKARGSINKERNELICQQYLSGEYVLDDVGALHGITRERVRQILVLHGHHDRPAGFLKPDKIAARVSIMENRARAETRKLEKLAERNRAREMYDSGATYAEIAEHLGHVITWVQQAVWMTGGPSRRSTARKPKRRLSPDECQRIADRYSSGVAKEEIAREFDICVNYVPTVANRMGAYRK